MKNLKNLHYLLSLTLLIGTFVSGYSVIANFASFYGYEGTLFKLTNCVVRNPVTTACFYGALCFLGTFIWSIMILKLEGEKKNKHLLYFNNLLIGAVIFAWSNFSLEAYKFLTRGTGIVLGCSGHPITNPLSTACFAGSVLFLASLILVILIRRFQKTATQTPTATI